jgi:hypothetical protein
MVGEFPFTACLQLMQRRKAMGLFDNDQTFELVATLLNFLSPSLVAGVK